LLAAARAMPVKSQLDSVDPQNTPAHIRTNACIDSVEMAFRRGISTFSVDPYAGTVKYMSEKAVITVLSPVLDGVPIY
jgi:hypothetical protein